MLLVPHSCHPLQLCFLKKVKEMPLKTGRMEERTDRPTDKQTDRQTDNPRGSPPNLFWTQVFEIIQLCAVAIVNSQE